MSMTSKKTFVQRFVVALITGLIAGITAVVFFLLVSVLTDLLFNPVNAPGWEQRQLGMLISGFISFSFYSAVFMYHQLLKDSGSNPKFITKYALSVIITFLAKGYFEGGLHKESIFMLTVSALLIVPILSTVFVLIFKELVREKLPL